MTVVSWPSESLSVPCISTPESSVEGPGPVPVSHAANPQFDTWKHQRGSMINPRLLSVPGQTTRQTTRQLPEVGEGVPHPFVILIPFSSRRCPHRAGPVTGAIYDSVLRKEGGESKSDERPRPPIPPRDTPLPPIKIVKQSSLCQQGYTRPRRLCLSPLGTANLTKR